MTWFVVGFFAGSVASNIPVPVGVPVMDVIVLSIGCVTEDHMLSVAEAGAVSTDAEFDKEVVPIPAPRT